MMTTTLSTVARHYLGAALWAGTTDDGQPLDDFFNLEDCSDELILKAETDCADFLRMAYPLDHSDWSEQQMGHDFLLTRCGHGSGFWSRDLGTEFVRERLTEIAYSFGDLYVYAGDDGKLYGD